MRVVYVHTTRLNSEKANVVQVLNMCKALVHEGCDVKLLVPESLGAVADKLVAKEILGEEPKFEIVSFASHSILRWFSNVGQIWGVRKVLRDLKENWQPEVCIIRHPVLLASAVRLHLPVVFEIHGARVHNKSRVIDFLRRKQTVWLSKKRNVRVFVTISENLGDFWIRQGVPREKVRVLHDGFDAQSFRKEMDREIARKELALPPDRPIVTYAGSLYKNRGIEDIFALARLFPHVLFVIVGGPEDRRRQLIAQGCDNENVRLVGRVSPVEVPRYLSASDILLMIWGQDVPTIEFCSPLKMFEYMASGRLIVGHGYTSIREVLKHREHALLANPGSFEELRKLLEEAVKCRLESRIPEAARKLAFERYTWAHRAKRLCQAFLETGETRPRDSLCSAQHG